MTGAVLHVVLVQPEIPPNTGNIGRLCAATGSRLHLVGPLGFSLEDRYLRRAGLDYWPSVDLAVHSDWAAFLERERPHALRCFSARAGPTYLEADYRAAGEPVHLVFGGESAGLPTAIRTAYADVFYRIPIRARAVRSLNVANAVAVVVYEALRRRGELA